MNSRTVFLCEDTADGIFTGIYKAWEMGTSRTGIAVKGLGTLNLFDSYCDTVTDSHLACKVASSIQKKLSMDIYSWCYHVVLSDVTDKGQLLYEFLQKAFRIGPSIVNYLQDPTVNRVFTITNTVSKEVHHYLGFVQFEELNNGVLISRINPKSNVIPLIATHFADRLHCENWIILDTNRDIAAVHSAERGYCITYELNEAKLLNFAPLSANEARYKELWKNFFSSIAISERYNPELQRNLLPLRYRRYMTLN